jgi:hypothetical protein
MAAITWSNPVEAAECNLAPTLLGFVGLVVVAIFML